MYEIEKCIKITEAKSGRPKTGPKYPFRKMNVGDSFSIPFENKYEARKIQSRLLMSTRRERFPNGEKFTTRTLDNCIRCWRIE